MIINGIDFEIIQNIKKIKKIYIRFKNINNKNYLIINTRKRLNELEIRNLINKNPKVIDKLIKNIVISPLQENEILILGKVFDISQKDDLIIESNYKIKNLFDYYKLLFNKNTTTLKFRKMKTRWGVCHISKNYISLSSYLIHLPINLIEYVIIHEFCHFLHPNHSKEFYNEVKKYCPDYKERAKDLKSFSHVLN